MTAPQATNGSQGLNIEDFKVSLNNTELNKVIQTEELFLLHKMSKRLACLNQEVEKNLQYHVARLPQMYRMFNDLVLTHS